MNFTLILSLVMFILSTLLAGCGAAFANCLPGSQTALTIVQAADAYTIIKYDQQGQSHYDRGMPFCGHEMWHEIGCVGASNIAIRLLEKPTKATCVANYVAAIGYGFYIRKAIGVQILKVRI